MANGAVCRERGELAAGATGPEGALAADLAQPPVGVAEPELGLLDAPLAGEDLPLDAVGERHPPVAGGQGAPVHSGGAARQLVRFLELAPLRENLGQVDQGVGGALMPLPEELAPQAEGVAEAALGSFQFAPLEL